MMRLSQAVTPVRLAVVAGLTLAWCSLWGEVSAANVLAGAVAALVVTSRGLGPPRHGRVRLTPLVRFAGLVTADLVVSTVTVAREVLTPTDHTEEAIVAVETPGGTNRNVLLLVIAVTVTPGTAVVDADPDTGTLYLHLLHADRREATVAHVRRLTELASEAFPEPPRPTVEVVR